MVIDGKKDLGVALFVLLGIVACVVSLKGNFETPEYKNQQDDGQPNRFEESYFKEVSSTVTKDGRPSLSLDASELVTNNTTGKTLFFNPRGIAFTSSGSPVNYTARKGITYQRQQSLHLESDVKLRMENSELMSDQAVYETMKQVVEADGNVRSQMAMPKTGDRIYVNSDKAFAWPETDVARYVGNVDGYIKRQKKYEENLYFNSDDLYSYGQQLKIDLIGNVVLKKPGVDSTAHRGEIFLENYNKKLKYFVLYDDVKVTEKVMLEGEKVLIRKAFGEKLEGIVSEDKMILTGSPKVLQEKDIIKGNVIVLRENSEVVEVDDANTNFIIK